MWYQILSLQGLLLVSLFFRSHSLKSPDMSSSLRTVMYYSLSLLPFNLSTWPVYCLIRLSVFFSNVEITGPHVATFAPGYLRRNGSEVIDKPPNSPKLGRVIFFRLDLQRSTCLASDLQMTSKWSKLSPIGWRHLTLINSTQGQKPLIHSVTNV